MAFLTILQPNLPAMRVFVAIDSNENGYANFPASDLFSPTRAERSFFVLSIAVLFVLSMCGNILTVFVNLRRKLRLFFRLCLISLACSDLLTTFFLSITYMSQFSSEYVQYWNFSETMCHVVPFITISAIMVSSLTLLGIAADRYYAVRVTTNTWNPTCSFCLLCFLLIWIASITISSPIYFIYEFVNFYVIDNMSTTISSNALQPELVVMCISNQDKIGVFYIVIVFLIFVPCVVAFLWLNTIVAITIWHRRRPITMTKKSAMMTTTTTTAASTLKPCHTSVRPKRNSVQLFGVSGEGSATTVISNLEAQQQPQKEQYAKTPTVHNAQSTRSTRELRHIKLFTIIIVMMFVFLICRLPAWILLMLRMCGIRMNETIWRLYYYFGLMHLSSCMLNPLFYTFLSETIEYAQFMRLKIFKTACGLRLCCEVTHTCNVSPMPSTIYGGVEDDIISLPAERFVRCHLCCRRTTTLIVAAKQNVNKQQQTPKKIRTSEKKVDSANIRVTNLDTQQQQHPQENHSQSVSSIH